MQFLDLSKLSGFGGVSGLPVFQGLKLAVLSLSIWTNGLMASFFLTLGVGP